MGVLKSQSIWVVYDIALLTLSLTINPSGPSPLLNTPLRNHGLVENPTCWDHLGAV